MNINYLGKDLITDWKTFINGNTALVLKDSISSESIFTVSINTSKSYPDDLIGIRSDEPYFKNALIEQGVIEKDVITIEPSGMISIQFYTLSKEAYNEMRICKERHLSSKNKYFIER